MKIYELVSENMQHVGGPMGSDYTYANWKRYFTTLDKAKEVAVMDYKKIIKWHKTDKGFRSDDLLYVMYYINIIIPEEK